MRLIIKDFLSQLKEKDELDFLLCDLLLQMGYTTKSRPQTGNRQFGVDIRADKENDMLLCVIKQGNLSRSNWSSGQNAVRPSIEEIHDCYIKQIPDRDKAKNIRIAVISNGTIEEAVRPNWDGYVSSNTNWEGIKIDIDFWSIDTLTELVEKYLFSEHLFTNELQSTLRRALYFIGESDYHKEYYEQIVDALLSKLRVDDSLKKQKKILSTTHLACQMIALYAAESQLYSIAIAISEYLIIRYWKFLSINNSFDNESLIKWISIFSLDYEKWNQKYYETVKYCCEGDNRVPFIHPLEQRVKLYEIVGFLTSYAYYLYCKGSYFNESIDKAKGIRNSIIELINHHPQFKYAPYDRHISTLNMLCRSLTLMGSKENAWILLNNHFTTTAYNYSFFKKYPSPSDTFEDALNIEMGFSAVEYNTSVYWGNILEWLVALGKEDSYPYVQQFLSEELTEVTPCSWFIKLEEEEKFYDKYAPYNIGDGVAFTPHKSFKELQEDINLVKEHYSYESFSFNEYSFDALEFIICRYYNYPVYVKDESPQNTPTQQ